MSALYLQIDTALKSIANQLQQDEVGQTMVEYVMLIALVSLAVFILAPDVRSGISAVFQNTSSVLM